jgi:hypothetical protein
MQLWQCLFATWVPSPTLWSGISGPNAWWNDALFAPSLPSWSKKIMNIAPIKDAKCSAKRHPLPAMSVTKLLQANPPRRQATSDEGSRVKEG